jgi:hypothetical protein
MDAIFFVGGQRMLGFISFYIPGDPVEGQHMLGFIIPGDPVEGQHVLGFIY